MQETKPTSCQQRHHCLLHKVVVSGVCFFSSNETFGPLNFDYSMQEVSQLPAASQQYHHSLLGSVGMDIQHQRIS